MRLRFFLSILAVLVVTVVATSVVHFKFFRTERLRLVDQQIQGLASSLISNLSVVEFEDMEEADDVIAETLGSERLTMVIFIRSEKGEVYYQNRNAEVLEYVPPLEPQWQTIKHEGHLIRLLSLPLKEQSWILQVGLVLDQGQVHWRTLSYSVFFYIGAIVLLMLVGAYFLTAVLLRPLRVLAAYLKHLAETSEASRIQEMPLGLVADAPQGRWRLNRSDEFTELLLAVRALNLKTREQLQATRVWTAQMAHELKTPLTIIRNCVETAQLAPGEAENPVLREAQMEIDHLGRIITSFLEWIRLEKGTAVGEDLHAIRLVDFARAIADKLNKLNSSRIRVECAQETTVFAKPDLLGQVITNLLQNALQYSPLGEPVRLVVSKDELCVEDRGPGVPESVRKKIGQPFNWGQELHAAASASALTTRGSGLGLAWIATVCEKYGWQFKLECEPNTGTRALVKFVS